MIPQTPAQVEALIHGESVIAFMVQGAEKPTIQLERTWIDYAEAIAMRDWLIAATGGEGPPGFKELLERQTNMTREEATVLYGRMRELYRRDIPDETLPAAPQVGEP